MRNSGIEIYQNLLKGAVSIDIAKILIDYADQIDEVLDANDKDGNC